MKIKIYMLFFVIFLISCTSDSIVTEEREEFFGIFKNYARKKISDRPKTIATLGKKKTSRWLSKFKQPIILVSSTDHKHEATLVALGNNKEKLTWVSADGVSFTFDQGMLIATRGYSQDLLSLNYDSPKILFQSKKITYKKVHRYLNGENRYSDITFNCVGKKIPSETVEILEYNIVVDRFIEECNSERHTYRNEYDLLTGTEIVILSKQWISPANQYFLTYNMYAFQKNL